VASCYAVIAPNSSRMYQPRGSFQVQIKVAQSSLSDSSFFCALTNAAESTDTKLRR